MELYEDQKIVMADIRQAYREGARAPLLVAPTGFGKTVVFSAICKGAVERGNRCMILVHRQELVDQVSKTLGDFGVSHGIIAADYQAHPMRAVQVASVFTLKRRLQETLQPHLIVIDEAHHAIKNSTWGKAIAGFAGSRLLGVTATPTRLSGEGLGDIFDRLVEGPTVQTLIDAGRLSRVRIFAPPTIDVSDVGTQMGDFKRGQLNAVADKPKVTGDAITHYQQHTPGQRAAVFCVSLEHARHIADAARMAGISAVMIDGGMDKYLRREVVNDFKNGHIKWLVSVDLISEGFDCPGIEVGISLRPTQSLGLWLQQCGRCIRTHPGKTHATILDHAGNSLRHGLPTETRSWTLVGSAEKRGSKTQSTSVRVCPSCFSAQRSGGSTCVSCGVTFKVEPRTVAREEGTLEEITEEEIARRRERKNQGQAQTLQALIELGRIRGYGSRSERWASHVFAARQKKRTLVSG